MFNFDWWVQVLNENLCLIVSVFCTQLFLPSQVLQKFEVAGQVLKDISYGKEDVPVPCVNSVDNSLPEYLEYSTKRLPQQGVNVPFRKMLFAMSSYQ